MAEFRKERLCKGAQDGEARDDLRCRRLLAISIFPTLFIFCVTSPGFAQTEASSSPAARKLTLADAIDSAEANYPKVKAALEQKSAASAAVGLARTAYLPRIDLLWQTNRATANNIYGLLLPQAVVPSISGPVIQEDDSRSAWGSAGAALASWQPFDFGLRRAHVNVARQDEAAAKAGINLTRLDVALATAHAYFDLVTAEQLAVVAQANVRRIQSFADAVHVLVNNQLRPGADAAQADASLALARTSLIQAQTNIQVRRAALAYLAGITDRNFDMDDVQFLSSAPAGPPETSSVKAHPAAQQEAAVVGEQQARLSVLRHSYVPQFNAQAAISGRGTGAALNGSFSGGASGVAPSVLNWATGVEVTFPALDIFSLREQKKIQEANVCAEQARYNETIDDLSARSQQAAAELEGARQVAQNTPIELAAARQSEAQQNARFQASLATVVDVSAAESLLVQAEADDALARINVWRALAGLAGARGDLIPFLNLLKPRQ